MKVESTRDPVIIKKVLDFLNAHKKMVLAVLDQQGHPDASLVLYAIDDDLNVYFGTKKVFGKYKAVHANPHVAAAIEQEVLDPLQIVDIKGVVEEMPAEKTEELMKWFTSKNESTYYVKDAEDYVMLKIVPTRLRWLDATSGELEIYDIDLKAIHGS